MCSKNLEFMTQWREDCWKELKYNWLILQAQQSTVHITLTYKRENSESADLCQDKFCLDLESISRLDDFQNLTTGTSLSKDISTPDEQNLTGTYLSKGTSMIKFAWRSDQFSGNMSQTVEICLIRQCMLKNPPNCSRMQMISKMWSILPRPKIRRW